MINYSYTAVNDRGRKIRGEMLAENELSLESRLKELELDLIGYKEVKDKKAGLFASIKTQDMIVFCLHMEQLDRAGVPLHESLADARDSTESLKLKNVLAGVYESVKSGNLLSVSFAQHPAVFNNVFVGLIEAGEKTGNLNESFANLIEHMKWSDEIRSKVKKAIRYPIILMIVLIGVISILMLFVVPKLIDFITSQGFDIPLHTELLISFSHFFGEYWYIVVGTPVVLIFSLSLLYRMSEPFAYFVDNLTLKIPAIGDVVRKINLARFTHFFSVMFGSGIDILNSLQAGKNVIGNRVISESVELIHKSVTEGNSLTESLRISNQFPNLVIRMFKVGEDSGNLNDSLENINFFYTREVNDAVDGMIALIQPVMTVVMGSLIFWIIAGVFGPLYGSFSQMDF